jgi:hypothetical protein
MRIALQDLHLDQLVVVYPGEKTFPLDDKVMVQGLETIATGAWQVQT